MIGLLGHLVARPLQAECRFNLSYNSQATVFALFGYLNYSINCVLKPNFLSQASINPVIPKFRLIDPSLLVTSEARLPQLFSYSVKS